MEERGMWGEGDEGERGRDVQLVHEHHPGPVGVLCAPLVEEVARGGEGVEHECWSAEESEEDHIPYRTKVNESAQM